ncbi:MAG TPA: hypothetical protein VI874_01780, partial [Candidatus Norongarragalinales archaeon]|nr:hypothetical protein [Candidatus Norongarragalinales archaeon]
MFPKALLVAIVFLSAMLSAAFVDPSVPSALETQSSIPVLLVFKEGKNSPLAFPDDWDDTKSTLRASGVRNFHKFQSFPIASGRMGRRAFNALRYDSNIEGIYYDLPIHAMDATSNAQINATLVQNRVKSGQNLTGQNQTLCILDTGIDYRHEFFGGCSGPAAGTQQNANQSNALDSVHSYSNDLNQTFTVTKNGFTRIAVHFVNVSLEEGFDFLYVEDPSGRQIAAYTGGNK